MRRLLTGVDNAGRSCAVEDGEMAFMDIAARSGAHDPFARSPIFEMDVSNRSGVVRWSVMRFGPGFAAPMHHTDSVDFDVVLEGSLEILLGDGAHRLDAGDCVVIPGVEHGWKAGPDGCVMSVTIIGTPPTT